VLNRNARGAETPYEKRGTGTTTMMLQLKNAKEIVELLPDKIENEIFEINATACAVM